MDSELKSVLESIQKRLECIELKINQEENVANNSNHQSSAGATFSGLDQSEQNVGPTGGVENHVTETSASRRADDVLREFDGIKERLSKVNLPPHLKVQDSAAGIKQESRSALRILSKSARFAETTLRQIAVISSSSRQNQEDQFFNISEEDLSTLYAISAAQVQFLQGEYASLVVKNTFDEETSRLFKSFENHSSAFSPSSLQNLRVAADLASARERASRGHFRGGTGRSSFRSRGGFQYSTNRGFTGRGRGYSYSSDWMSSRRPPIDRPSDEGH